MKVSKFNEDLKRMNPQQLQEKLAELRGQLFGLKLKARTAHVKNNAEFQLLRGSIARVLTFIKQQELQSATR